MNELIELHEILLKRFDEDELKTLCFKLRISYEALPAPGIEGKARELVALCDRHGRLPELVQAINKQRPRIVLSDVLMAYLPDRKPIVDEMTPVTLPNRKSDASGREPNEDAEPLKNQVRNFVEKNIGKIGVIVGVVLIGIILLTLPGLIQAPENPTPTTQTETLSAVTNVSPVPTSTLTPILTVDPSIPPPNPDGPTTHTIQAGESIGSISQLYGVPVADIMAANGIENPNFIQVNQVLIIPNIAPTPMPTEPPVEGEAVVEISEVVGVGSLAEEAVSIVNSGNRPIALLDWEVTDESGTVYTFGQVTLFGEGGGILLHTEAGQDGASDLYWGLEQPVWESGETVALTDAEGTVRVTYTIP